MSAIDLKAGLHQMIEQEGNEQVLRHIKETLEQNVHIPIAELGGQTIYEFNKEMEEAEAEMYKGEFLTHEEVSEMFEKMFKK